MRLEGRSLNKGSIMSSSNNRKKPYGLLLLVALGAALLSVIVLHKLRERRVLGLLVQDRERQLLTFHILLKKERDKSKEIKSRLDELRDKTISLSHQKDELYNKLIQKETTIDDLKRIQKEMEASLDSREEQINQITQKLGECRGANRRQVSSLTELLKQKESEIEEMKRQILQVHQPINSTAQQEIVSNVTTDLDNTKEHENLPDRSLASTADPTHSKSSEAKTHVGNANDTATSQQVNSIKDTWVRLETIIEEDHVLKEDNVSSAEDLQDNNLIKIHASQGIEDTVKGGQVVNNEEQIDQLTTEESNFATGDSIPKSDVMEVTEAGELNKFENSQLGNELTKTSTDGVDLTIAQPKMKHHRNKRIKTKTRRRPIFEHSTVPQHVKSATRAETVDSSTMDIDIKEQVITSDQPQQLAQLIQDSTDAGSGNSDEKEETIHSTEHNTISEEDEKSVTRAETIDSSIVDFGSKEEVTSSDQPRELAQLTEDPTDAGSSNSDEKEETFLPSEHNTVSQKDEKLVTRTETVDSSTVDFDRKEQVIASDQPQKFAQLTEDSTDAGSSNNDEKEEIIHPSEHNTVAQKDETSITRAETVDSSTVDFDDSKEQVIASDHIQQLAQLTEDSTDAGRSNSDKKEETIQPSATNLELTTSHEERQAAE